MYRNSAVGESIHDWKALSLDSAFINLPELPMPAAELTKSGGGKPLDQMKNCRICPRECGADRTSGRPGFCRAPGKVILARAALHLWEEPCISGRSGSGAVFYSGCSLGCIYCQNAAISGVRDGSVLPGTGVSIDELAGIFLRLQGEGANNINLVTASHYIPQTAAALRIAKKRGLHIPVIYNSGGYEKVSSLRLLEGLVDVYLPDCKYWSAETARMYSRAPDYPEIARDAIAEMVRQAGKCVFYEADGGQLIKKGVIVRHLLLPGHVSEAKEILAYLHGTYGDSIFLSIMNQYTPMPAVSGLPLLSRRTTRREYDRLTDYAIQIGVKNGFIQEGGTAKESFIPAWNGEGVR